MADAKRLPALQQPAADVDHLTGWIADGCPGGPWKALEPLQRLAGFVAGLDALAVSDEALRVALERVANAIGSAS